MMNVACGYRVCLFQNFRLVFYILLLDENAKQFRANLPDDPVISMAFKFLALITVTVNRPAVGR